MEGEESSNGSVGWRRKRITWWIVGGIGGGILRSMEDGGRGEGVTGRGGCLKGKKGEGKP